MRIYKFGGASVKDANGVKNLAKILRHQGHKDLLVVVSAMGKTTNALELVVANYFSNPTEILSALQDVIKYHNDVLFDLFDADGPNSENNAVFSSVRTLFDELKNFLNVNKSPDYNFVYDQVIGYGELVSTTIVGAYLNAIGIKNNWIDVRNYIKTDANYRNATIDWAVTQQNVASTFNTKVLNITQGFLGSDNNNFTTSLGREGSDYTAAIFAFCLNAESVTIWKDVPGVLNADPRYFENAQLLQQISYEEAIELAFYGASVIHPKTLQPLQRKEIPLYVKSFLHPEKLGTRVSKGAQLLPKIPCYIVKRQQVLVSLSSLDFSYIVEDNISYIFGLLHKHKMKVDVIQNSAISFSVCFENTFNTLETLILELKSKFKVNYFTNVALYTIRHFTENVVLDIEKDKTILLKQVTQDTVQIITKQ